MASARINMPTACLLGVVIALLGDAGHVASGTTEYAASRWPRLLLSPAWFPLLIGGALLVVAGLGRRLGLPSRPRTRTQLALAVIAVLALYWVTSLLRTMRPWLAVALTGALALSMWYAWDRSVRCFSVALACAVAGPTAEMACVAAGLYRYADGSLYGVAPWLPCLFFGVGAVTSGISSGDAPRGALCA